jgi:hypothetical protein
MEHLNYTRAEHPGISDGYLRAVTLLGTDDASTNNAVQIIASEAFPSNELAYKPEEVSFVLVDDTDPEASVLVANADGLPRRTPGDIVLNAPRVRPTAIIDTLNLGTTWLMQLEGSVYYLQAYKNFDVYHVDWPEGMGISGDVKLDDGVTSFELTFRLQYPLEAVVERLDVDSSIYTLLEDHALEDEYFTADRPEEKIALVVLAMTKEEQKLYK